MGCVESGLNDPYAGGMNSGGMNGGPGMHNGMNGMNGGPMYPAGGVPMSTGMGGQTVINQGAQRCVRCEGKGFCHDSNMNHDKAPGQKCFFCTDCRGCGGSGMVQGGSAVISGGGMMPGMGGMGGMGGGTTVINRGAQRCVRCEGNGFCHDSNMNHDKAPGQKCFFCTDCRGCGGSGMVEGGSAVISGGGMMPGMGGTTVINTGPKRCMRCEGHGFCHDSSMNHDKAPGEKCFFCTDCRGCGGSGMVQ